MVIQKFSTNFTQHFYYVNLSTSFYLIEIHFTRSYLIPQEERNRQNDIISLISIGYHKNYNKKDICVSYAAYRGFVDEVAQRAGTETARLISSRSTLDPSRQTSCFVIPLEFTCEFKNCESKNIRLIEDLL